MNGVSSRRAVGFCLLVLCMVAFGAGAFAMECDSAAGCPMMASMSSSHCGSGTALTSNCCASMEQAAELFELPKSSPTQLAGLDRDPSRLLDPSAAPPREAAGPIEAAPRTLALYALFLAFLL